MIVTLIKPHTHAGLDYQPGDTLDVDEATARWLNANGIARHDRQPAPQPQGDGTPLKPKPTQRKESKS